MKFNIVEKKQKYTDRFGMYFLNEEYHMNIDWKSIVDKLIKVGDLDEFLCAQLSSDMLDNNCLF